MWAYDDSRAALRDALRLSRAMTYKAAVADLPLGGGKGVIMLPRRRARSTRERRHAALLDFGDTVDALGGRYITAEDVGTSSRDMTRDRGAHRVTSAGLSRARGGSGDPSPFTALGVEAAIEACCERVFGCDLAARPHDRRGRARPRRLARRQALRPGRREAGRWPTSTARKRALAERARRALDDARAGADRRGRRARAVRAGRRARRRDRAAAALPR